VPLGWRLTPSGKRFSTVPDPQPYRLVLEYAAKPSPLTENALPLVPRVDEELRGNRQRAEVPTEGPTLEWLVAALHDRDDVEIAADTPVTPRVGTITADSQELRVAKRLLARPEACRREHRFALRPFEYG
jgi:hypothetical protein